MRNLHHFVEASGPPPGGSGKYDHATASGRYASVQNSTSSLKRYSEVNVTRYAASSASAPPVSPGGNGAGRGGSAVPGSSKVPSAVCA
jgi:hypothetical protein